MSTSTNTIYAYIDGQNLDIGTRSSKYKWRIDAKKFYVYLKDKFKITKAFYYFGVRNRKYENIYKIFSQAGFILQFRRHTKYQKSYKKGNVDVDITRTFYEQKKVKFVLVTQDGDYIRLTEHLLKNNKLTRIIFPNANKASSLYLFLPNKYWLNLSTPHIISKIGKK